MEKLLPAARFSARVKLLTVAFASLAGFLLVVVADRLVGATLPRPRQPIVFPPNVSVDHETVEFRYTTTTNSYGFRGGEVSRLHDGVFRIVAIGDSFTYGWGVELEDSWPKVLERNLRTAGFAAEVLNLGAPGTTTDVYAEIAERAIPQLLPDLVIVAVLQTDDLYQLSSLPGPRAMGMARRVVSTLMPHLSLWAAGARTLTVSDPPQQARGRDDSKGAAREVVAGFTLTERQRYDALDDELKRLFLAGEINPSVMAIDIRDPAYYRFPRDDMRARLPEIIATMAGHLARIAEASRLGRAKMIVVPMPIGSYIDPRAWSADKRFGLEMSPDLLTAMEPDLQIQRACQGAGVEFVSVTARMRTKRPDLPADFALDGHPNAIGHRNFAEELQEVFDGAPRYPGQMTFSRPGADNSTCRRAEFGAGVLGVTRTGRSAAEAGAPGLPERPSVESTARRQRRDTRLHQAPGPDRNT